MNDLVFNSVFWLSMAGLMSGVIALVFTAINKSKCKTINCCGGLFSCSRDTEAEVVLEERRMELGLPPESPQIKNNL